MIEVRPIAVALGAEIHGLDLSRPLDDGDVAAIRSALLEHLVIFFRRQDLTPEAHKAFTASFGALQIDHMVAGWGNHPEIMELVKEPGDTKTFGANWHADVTFQEAPSLGSALYALEIPGLGGDTLFANMYMAYDALSDGMKRMLGAMTAHHCAYPAYSRDYMDAAGGIAYTDAEPRDFSATHPVVRTHPETGRRALFVNGSYTRRFTDMTEAESQPLLKYLYEHAARPEFTCRFAWEKGSLAFWDNRCTHHCPINDSSGERRRMHRVTVVGDRPR